MERKPICTDISTIYNFNKFGCRFTRRSYNENTGVYVFERYAKDENGKEYLQCLEIVKGVPVINSDGSLAKAYPSSERFGVYGKCVVINKYTDAIETFLVNNPDKWGPEDLHSFKMSLTYADKCKNQQNEGK